MVIQPTLVEMLEKAHRQIAKALAAARRGDEEAARVAILRGGLANLNAALDRLNGRGMP